MAWLNKVENPLPQEINAIKTRSSAKGIILVTEQYECFLFSDSKLALQLLHAVSLWVEDKNMGYLLTIVPDSKEKAGFRVEKTKNKGNFIPKKWFQTDSGYSTTEEVEEDNPFL